MPPFVRFLVQFMIALPGALIWFLSGLMAMVGCSGLLIGTSGKMDLLEMLFTPACFAGVVTGHVMQIFAGNLVGDPHYRVPGNQTGARLAWDIAADFLGIATASAGIAFVPCLVTGQWLRMASCLALLAILGFGLFHVVRKRAKLRATWLQEIIDLRTQRAG